MKSIMAVCSFAVLLVAVFIFFSTEVPQSALLVLTDKHHIGKCFEYIQKMHPDTSAEDYSVTREDLNRDKIDDYIVSIQTSDFCGSAGCVHELCIFDGVGELEEINFGLAAHTVHKLETVTNGMHDLELNENTELHLRWNENRYELQ